MKNQTRSTAFASGAGSVSALDIIERIFERSEDALPNQRFQDPKILIRRDVSRPFYYILASVPIVTERGLQRKRQSFPLGYCDEITIRQAKAAKQQILAPINGGRFLIQSQIRFGDLAKKFEDARIPQLGAATQGKYRAHLHNHLLPAFEDMMLCDITTTVIEAWLNEKAEAKIRTVVRNHVSSTSEHDGMGWYARMDLRNLLSAIFSKANEWKLWDGRNPCDGVKLGKKKAKRPKRILKPADFANFLRSITDTSIIPADGARLIVLVAAVAGLRVSEVLGLQVRDIDKQAETLRVERRQHRGDIDAPKSESSRRVRQIGALARELSRYTIGCGPEDFIFTRPDRGLLDDRDLQQHVFRPAAESAGIYFEGFGMHTFRRLNVTWRQEAGATPIEAQKAAGHATLDMTYLYTMADEEREKEHVTRILERLNIVGIECPSQPSELAVMPTVGGVQ